MVKIKKKREDPGKAAPTRGRGQIINGKLVGPGANRPGKLPLGEKKKFSMTIGGKQEFFATKEEFEAGKLKLGKERQQEDIARQDEIRAGPQGTEEPREIVRDAFVDELGFPRPGILETQDEAQERAERKAGNILTVGALGAAGAVGLTAKGAASLQRVTSVSNEVATIGKLADGSYGKVASNTKSFATTKSFLQKVFSAKSMIILGGAASTMFLGMWGQAEAAEPLSIIMRDILREAERTGDFSIYDEAKEARDEILDLEKWEQIALKTPIAPVVGIPNKIKGAIKAAGIMDKQADSLRP